MSTYPPHVLVSTGVARDVPSPEGQVPPGHPDAPAVVAGSFNIKVTNPATFVADPIARRMAAASVARLAAIDIGDVRVQLTSHPGDSRRLRADEAVGFVMIEYAINLANRNAEPTAASLRSTAPILASQVFEQELERAGLDVEVRASYSIIVISITARTWASQLTTHSSPPTAGENGPSSSSGTGISTVAIAVGGIVAVFLCLQCCTCICRKFEPCKELVGEFQGIIFRLGRTSYVGACRVVNQPILNSSGSYEFWTAQGAGLS